MDQNSPLICPFSSISMLSAAGLFGRPGMVSTFPVSATMNPAPSDGRNSRTVMRKPYGAPYSLTRSHKEVGVLAMHTGILSQPFFTISSSCALASSV